MTYLVPDKKLRNVICSLDDFYPDYEANALSELYYLKDLYPNFKVTLFAIPKRGGKHHRTFFKTIAKIPWIELAIHGVYHTPNECDKWDKGQAEYILREYENYPEFVNVFKAPAWKFSKGLYEALKERDWICADIETNKDKWPDGLKVYSTGHPECIHGHTWDLNNPKPEYNNGIKQIIKRGVPWFDKTKFRFITEAM